MVHVVDEDEPFRTVLKCFLETIGYGVRTYASVVDFLLNKSENPQGCVILGLGAADAFDLQGALVKLDEPLPIIFIGKPIQSEALLHAVRSAVADQVKRRLTPDQLLGLRSRYEFLTPRERETFTEIVGGKLNRQIADKFGTSERTVKKYQARVMKRMKVTSVAELFHVADQLKLWA